MHDQYLGLNHHLDCRWYHDEWVADVQAMVVIFEVLTLVLLVACSMLLHARERVLEKMRVGLVGGVDARPTQDLAWLRIK